jgi:hypothetical protein
VRLSRYQRRKLIRRSFPYRARRWLQKSVMVRRIRSIAGWLSMLAMVIGGGLLLLIYAAGPDAGLLPPPWTAALCFGVGAAKYAWQGWEFLSHVIGDGKRQ